MKKCKLSEISTILNGYAFKSTKYVDNGIRIIRIANVQDGEIVDENPCFYPYETTDNIDKYKLFEGDLLISLTGNVGRVGVLPKSMMPAALNQRVCCLRINKEKVNLKYLFYYLRQYNFIQDCIKASKGVAQLNLSTKWLAEYEILLPELSEQQRIVERIEELFSQLDSAVETLKKTKQQLAIYRQAVLKEAFEGTLTNCKSKALTPIGMYIYKPRYGTSKKCDYNVAVNSTPVYRIPNINHAEGRICHKDIKYATFNDSELVDLKLEIDDILIIRSNGSVSLVGKAAIIKDVDIGGTFAGYLMRLRINKKSMLLPAYLLYYLQSYNARTYIENAAKSTSGVHNINSTEISALKIPIFDLIEQQHIVLAIENRISVCDSIEKTVDTALQQAEAMRQSILKKAFEGSF